MSIDTLEMTGHNPELDMNILPQLTPDELIEMHPLSPEAAEAIDGNRQIVTDILAGRDDRLLVMVGPCSLDNNRLDDGQPAVQKYAELLAEIAKDSEIAQSLFVVMRAPPAKPRTNLGMRGLEQTSVELARGLLSDVANGGMPLAMEVMHDRHLARYGDLLSMGWVGARNINDMHLRHALSAHPEMPVLLKNSDTGDMSPAVNASKTIAESHDNVELIMGDGRHGTMPKSAGNTNVGLLFRGGGDANPEGFEESLLSHARNAEEIDMPFTVDISHSNGAAHSGGQKSAEGEMAAGLHVIDLMRQGRLSNLRGVQIESYINAGSDNGVAGTSETDPCIDIQSTAELLAGFAAANKARQKND